MVGLRPIGRERIYLMAALRMGALVWFFWGSMASAESIESVLTAAGVPTASLPSDRLRQKITSYAVGKGDPFLLAYYQDDGSGFLHYPIRVIRYSATTHLFRMNDLSNISTTFSAEPAVSQDCLGSILSIAEFHGSVYIDTHANPSAGCLLILSDGLALKAALSGWLEGVMGANYAILHQSEVHFMSVHPMQLAVFDLARRKLTRLYPPKNDKLRQEFSRLIQAYMPADEWCIQTSSQCDPASFDSELDGRIAVDEAGRLFGFVAGFDAGGFGDSAATHVPPANVAYFFRLRYGGWQYREFRREELKWIFGLDDIQQIVSQKAGAIFAAHR